MYGVASWVRTKYWIDGDELRIDTGVVVRQSRRIRIDRLQGIDIVQPLAGPAVRARRAEVRRRVGQRPRGFARLACRTARRWSCSGSLLERRDDLREATERPGQGRGTVADRERRAGHPARLDPRPAPGASLAAVHRDAARSLVSGVALAVAFVSPGRSCWPVASSRRCSGLALALVRKLTVVLRVHGVGLRSRAARRRGLTSLSSQTMTRAPGCRGWW